MINQSFNRLAAIAAAGLASLLLLASPGASHALDVFADKHLGAATCATSQCHGKSSPQTGRNVQLNEYTIWIEGDRHSIAYQTLETKESARMAANLGLESAKTADICLDCHTDNAPQASRGPKFKIRDGVGCEACHGGADRWIKTHTDPDATHAANLAAGMIATETPEVRAELCLSCHLGTKDKFATHKIMGAGHPRLSFELDLFSSNQPAHYQVDADYVQRKGSIPRFNLWLIGQFISAEETLKVAIDRLHDGVGIFPDFAFYDCHSCHHSMDQKRWTRHRADNLAPGSLRLMLPNMAVIEATAATLGNKELRKTIRTLRIKTMRAAQGSKSGFNDTAGQLLSELTRTRESFPATFSDKQVSAVRRALLQTAGADRTSDFGEAEQIYYSLETLCLALDQLDSCGSALDQMFESIANANTYSPGKFARLAKKLASRF